MMYWNGSDGGGWAVGMVILMVVFWGSILALVWAGVRAFTQRPTDTRAVVRSDPRDVLAARLASGDIDPEDFQRRLDLLDSKR